MSDVPSAGDRCIVLVDDHDDTREVAAEILKIEGFVVRAFATAEEALVDVAHEPPLAVVSDLTLDGLSGEDLARSLRGSTATAHIKLLAMTGHTAAAANPESLWDRVLIKPVDPFELARVVHELVAR